MVVLFLESPYCLPNGWISVHSYQQCKNMPSSPHPLQHLLFVDFFPDSHSNWCEVILHCSFDLHFSNNEQCWTSFHAFIGHLSLEKCLSLIFFFWLGCLFFWYWAICAAYIFWRLILCQLLLLQWFSPFWGLSFHLVYCFCCCAKAFKLDRSTLFIFVFISKTLGDRSKINIVVIHVKECSAYVFLYECHTNWSYI